MPHEGITLPQVGRFRPVGHGAFRNFSRSVLEYMTRLVLEGADAPTYETIAAETQMSLQSLQITLRELEADGFLIREVKPSLFRYVVRGVGSTLWTPPGCTKAKGKEAASRKCLRCMKPFWSSHKHNRLCTNCKS